MQVKELICIGCPMGCPVKVTMEQGKVVGIEGNTCKRGAVYAEKEVTNPTRIVTSTVRVHGGTAPVVSVKTAADIPKGMIQECMKVLKTMEVKAPVVMGDILYKNVAGTGVDLVATRTVKADCGNPADVQQIL